MRSFLFLLLTVLVIPIGVAQKTIVEESDPRATTLLDKAKATFAGYTAYEINFSMEVTYPEQEEDSQKQSGMFIRKGQSYRVIMREQQIFCDGQSVWLYLPQENEVQINDADDEDIFMSPDQLLSFHESGDFLYKLEREFNDNGAKMAEIEFKPTDRMSEFFKVKMVINQQSSLPTFVKIFYKDGSRMTTNLLSVTPNKSYKKGFFTFDLDKHQGVKVEDLRL